MIIEIGRYCKCTCIIVEDFCNLCLVISDNLACYGLLQILDRVMYRVEWIRHQEREKKKLEDEKEKERGQFNNL